MWSRSLASARAVDLESEAAGPATSPPEASERQPIDGGHVPQADAPRIAADRALGDGALPEGATPASSVAGFAQAPGSLVDLGSGDGEAGDESEDTQPATAEELAAAVGASEGAAEALPAAPPAIVVPDEALPAAPKHPRLGAQSVVGDGACQSGGSCGAEDGERGRGRSRACASRPAPDGGQAGSSAAGEPGPGRPGRGAAAGGGARGRGRGKGGGGKGRGGGSASLKPQGMKAVPGFEEQAVQVAICEKKLPKTQSWCFVPLIYSALGYVPERLMKPGISTREQIDAAQPVWGTLFSHWHIWRRELQRAIEAFGRERFEAQFLPRGDGGAKGWTTALVFGNPQAYGRLPHPQGREQDNIVALLPCDSQNQLFASVFAITTSDLPAG